MYFFPTPYPGELLYSVLARYCKQSGYINVIHNMEDLFGTRNMVASPELQGNIDLLVANLPYNSEFSSEYFIHKHTVYPYIASFLPEKRAREVQEIMKKGKASLIYSKSGYISGHINQVCQFRFCPECMAEDIQKNGETYWHSLHQITAVFICPVHKIPLQNSSIPLRGAYRQNFVSANEDYCVTREISRFSEDVTEKLILMAKDIQKILERDFTYQSVNSHKYRYVDKLIELGFSNMNGMVHQKKLRYAILEFWGEEVLEILQCPIEKDKDCPWLNSLVRENNIPSQPIRHILISRFLGIDINAILDAELPGKSHQEIWQENLLSLANTGLSIREMAKRLNSTPKTVRKCMDKYGVTQFWIDNGGGKYKDIPFVETDEFRGKRDRAREEWLQLINQHPNLSRNKLKHVNETLYTRLMRYDKEWVDTHTPIIKFTRQPYWDNKDEELLPKVITVVNELYCGKPERVAWTTVGRKLGVGGWLCKRRDKMPKVKAYLEEKVETLQEYQLRKLEWAIDELVKEGASITKWNLLQKAGIKERYIINNNTRIEEILLRYGIDIDLLSLPIHKTE